MVKLLTSTVHSAYLELRVKMQRVMDSPACVIWEWWLKLCTPKHSNLNWIKEFISFFNSSFQLLIRTFPPSFLNGLHQFIELSNLLITHLVHRSLVQYVPFPIIPLKFLTILLPFGQEANDVEWIVDVLVSSEFCFKVCVSEDALFWT